MSESVETRAPEQPKPVKLPSTVNARGPSPAPAWIFPVFVSGLGLVFIGERVLAGLEKGSGIVTAVGVLAMVVATALRFAPRFRSGGERKSIEGLLAILSVIGLLGLGVYFLTTTAGQARVGIDQMVTEKREGVIGILTVIWVSLIAISVLPMLFAETALRPMRRAERPESRRVKAAATAGLTIILAAIYGALFVYAADGWGLKVDYSYFKTSGASESTRKLAASLTEPVKVTAFFPQVNEVRNEIQGYLREVALGNPKLQVQVQDRLLAPKLARELRVNQDGVITLTKGTSTQTMIIGTELENARPKLKTLDRDFQEQLLKAVRSSRTAYFTVGHGELNDATASSRSGAPKGRSADIVRTLLTKQNFVVKDLGLAQGLGNEVPSDADVVLVLGPTEAFANEEIATLQRYEDRGGKLLMAIDSDTASSRDILGDELGAAPSDTPKAADKDKAPEPLSATYRDALANIVGLKFDGAVLANDRQHVRVSFNDSDRARLISGSFSSHAAVSTLSRNAPRAAVVVFGSGSLDKAPGAAGNIDFAVRSPAGSYRDANRNFTQDKAGEQSGVFNIAAAVTKPVAGAAPAADAKDKAADKSAKEMRAFVTADADAFSDLVMSNVIGNQILLVDAVRWLIGEESFSGPTNTEEDVKIEHTKQQDLAWFYATIFGAPGLVLGLGLFVGRRYAQWRQKVKGLFVHIGLLVVASVLALSVWSRSEQPEKTNADLIEVWSGSPDSTTWVSFESKNRKVRLESRKDAQGRFYVGSVEKEEAPLVHASTGDGGAPPPPAPKPEKKIFIAVKAADELVAKLAPLKAVRSIGKIEAKQLEDFGLDKPEGTIKVNVAGKEHALVIGGNTPGGGERYAKYNNNGEVYAIPSDIVQSLQFAEDRLQEREFHGFNAEVVSRLRIAKGAKVRDIVRLSGKKDGWADSARPDKLDETVGNWISKLDRLRVQDYIEKPTPPVKPEDAIVRVEYFEGSKSIGFFELYKVPGEKGNDFLAKSEHGRWFVKVAASLAEQVEQDLASVLK